MQLVVQVAGLGDDEEEGRYELDTFADQDKVSARIARAVRNWIRVVPVRSSGSRLDLHITANWLEADQKHTHTSAELSNGQPKSKKKSKRRK